MTNKKPFILVDGSSYFYRAFHALPPLTNSKGLPTGAIFGVVNMIKRLIKDHEPTHMVVVFDAKGKTFRDEWFPDYKAHRPAAPKDLSVQFAPLNSLLNAMGLPVMSVEGVEADDVIGTLAQLGKAAGFSVLMSTSDKDMAQLVDDQVTLVNTMTSTELDINGVKKKFGVQPTQIIDYLALVGDSIDNVPGVPKCGAKTAAKWLEQYETLENLLDHADEITGKIGENLRASQAYLPLSKRLVTIKLDVELPLTLDQLQLKPANTESLIELTKEFEFKSWFKELTQSDSELQSTTAQQSHELLNPTTVQLVTTNNELHQAVEQLNQSTLLAISVYGTSSEPQLGMIAGIALVAEEQQAYYFPLICPDEQQDFKLEPSLVLDALAPLLNNQAIKKIGYNLKLVEHWFAHHQMTLRGLYFDVMLASYVLNSTASQHTLENLSLNYLGQAVISAESVQGKGAKFQTLDNIPVKQASEFAVNQAYACFKLYPVLDKLLSPALKTVLNTIEMPLSSILANMEQLGVLIDKKTLAKHGKRLKIRISDLEQQAFKLAGREFNLGSPKQLQEIFYTDLKLPVLAKTPKGQPSTAETVLLDLAADYELPAVILEYRSLTKLVSTYIDALPKRINKATGRVHTRYNQAITATGRLSSSEPNLQNIPIRNEEGRLIRTAFIAAENHVLLAADYSQIELRIMAHLSEDKGLLDAFAQGLDIHTATASELFQAPLNEVTHEQRRRAKAVNFGLIYGMSAFGLAKQIGVPRQEAELYMERYFARYPGVLRYMETTREQAREQGFVETVFGRRLYLPEINIQNMMRRKAAERMAINAPMQGTAADIIKKAMISIDNWQATLSHAPVKMILQVHDELLFEVLASEVDTLQETIRSLMENAVTIAVPLQVTLGVGANWDEAH